MFSSRFANVQCAPVQQTAKGIIGGDIQRGQRYQLIDQEPSQFKVQMNTSSQASQLSAFDVRMLLLLVVHTGIKLCKRMMYSNTTIINT